MKKGFKTITEEEEMEMAEACEKEFKTSKECKCR
jgi:hypothetical protein